jgi:hypothetical protein
LTIQSQRLWPQFKTELRAVGEHHNSNVSKILPLTTFRTIDLAGGEISGRLFSRFCAKMRVFFEGFFAPEYVQPEQAPERQGDGSLEAA